MPWAHGAASYSSVCAPTFTEDFPRSKSCTATISVGLQHSYELGTIIQILVLIYTSCLTLETLERLSSFFEGYISKYMSAPGSEPMLGLTAEPIICPLEQTTWEGLPLMHLSIYLKQAVHLYLVCANSNLLTKYILSEKVTWCVAW